MKKYLFVLLLSIVAICTIGVQPVYAHTLKIDRSVGVSLHINPEDEPTVGKESAIFVEITDASGRFNSANPSNCLCMLRIISEGNEVARLPIVNGGSYTQLRYTFPKSGSYTLVVEGKPNGEGQLFQSFTLSYEYFVKGSVRFDDVNPLLPLVPYIQALCGGIIVWMFVLVKRR